MQPKRIFLIAVSVTALVAGLTIPAGTTGSDDKSSFTTKKGNAYGKTKTKTDPTPTPDPTTPPPSPDPTTPPPSPDPTTPPPTSGPDQSFLDKYRNTNPAFSRFAGVRSDQLDVSQLLTPLQPDAQFFTFNGTATSQGQNGQFRTICDFSHLGYDDPIVFPGVAGKAHLHVFYGNTGTNAFTTSASIANTGGSSCDGHELNRTAYWVPAVYDQNGRVRLANHMMLYYKTEGVARPAGGYTAMPQGLKMLAGNPGTTGPQTVYYNHGWNCGANMFVNAASPVIPACAAPNKLTLKVSFPRCWDGINLDSADHRSHVVYPSGGSAGGTCPASHPKVFATAQMLFEWDLAPGDSTVGWYLSSDHGLPGGTTFHGDWFGGWHNAVMNSWTQGCLNAEWNCQTSFIGNQNIVLPAPAGLYDHLNTTSFTYLGKGPIILEALPPHLM